MPLPARGCNLRQTFESGQVFRWRPWGPRGWCGVLGPYVVTLHQAGSLLDVGGSAMPAILESLATRYLRLDEDPAPQLRAVDVDPVIHAALAATRGIRMVRQDPWECLASFICATFNNIRRIEGMLERLCRTYGRAVPYRGEIWFTFPSAAILARADAGALRRLGFGYRAPYLVRAAQQVDSGDIDLARMARLPYLEAREALLQVEGVGEKVVECVLLFGFSQFEAFPVDVWIGRVMRRVYFRGRKVTDRRIREFARRHFGPACGLAQQALYHAARTCPEVIVSAAVQKHNVNRNKSTVIPCICLEP